MSNFEKEINKAMQDIVKQKDTFILQNLSFKNLIELCRMVRAEIEKRLHEGNVGELYFETFGINDKEV